MINTVQMDIQVPSLQQDALDLLTAPDSATCCRRLWRSLHEIFPGAAITLLLTDRNQTRAVLYMADGEFSEESTAIQTAMNRIKVLCSAEGTPRTEPVVLHHSMETLLSISGQVIGLVTIRWLDSEAQFSAGARRIVRLLSLQAAASIELRRLYEAEQDRLADESALIEAGRRLSENLQPEVLPLRILEELVKVVPYERGSLLLREADNLRIAAQRGFPDDERVQRLNIAVRRGDVFDQIATTSKPVLMDDVTTAPGWTQVPWLPLNLSWLGIPLFAQDQVVGMVSLTRRDRAAFSPEDVLVASAFAMQASVALENASLYAEIWRFNQQLEQMVQERTEALRQALVTLERMDRNKSDFISVTAHELRTPLTVMKGYLGILETDPDFQAKPFLKQAMNGLLKGTERLHEIVESMLELARLESELLKIEPGLVAFSMIGKRVAADFEKYVLEREQKLELASLERLPVINGDPELLLKALRNVVINAIKYTPNGGQITLAGQERFDEQLGDCVEITVRDTGIGIDPENHELIFEKFYSLGEVGLHSSGKYSFKGGGPGLGLALARGIIQAHHGRIWVESERCDEQACPGSTFYILLPVQKPQPNA
jgi:signal transduction histidine kinase